MSVESLIVQLLNAHQPLRAWGLEACSQVPEQRPRRCITVERTGGSRGPITDAPQLAIQVWAETRDEANRLAELLADQLRPALLPHPRIARVNVNSVHNFPDYAGKGSPRAQIFMELVVTTSPPEMGVLTEARR